jgi:hypothetical protein
LSIGGSLSNVVRSQFLLAQYGINITESNQLAFFEYEVFLNLALEQEQQKIDEMKAESASMSRFSK